MLHIEVCLQVLGSTATYCMWKKKYNDLWLQRKLDVIWQTASSYAFKWLRGIVVNLVTRIWKQRGKKVELKTVSGSAM